MARTRELMARRRRVDSGKVAFLQEGRALILPATRRADEGIPAGVGNPTATLPSLV